MRRIHHAMICVVGGPLIAGLTGCASPAPHKQHYLHLVNATVAPSEAPDQHLARAFGLDEFERNDRAIAVARASEQ